MANLFLFTGASGVFTVNILLITLAFSKMFKFVLLVSLQIFQIITLNLKNHEIP